MKEGLIALNYECSKCNERMGLYERKSAVLDGDFEWVCSTITSQNIYGRTPMILLTMRPSRLFVKIRCHAVASTRKRSASNGCSEGIGTRQYRHVRDQHITTACQCEATVYTLRETVRGQARPSPRSHSISKSPTILEGLHKDLVLKAPSSQGCVLEMLGWQYT
ncbi:hypothetical protein TNCV_5034501 [Trichonephila clavipes]|nr:hypothetical protein TNCV_5034501 [Trichonephila clavipes]